MAHEARHEERIIAQAGTRLGRQSGHILRRRSRSRRSGGSELDWRKTGEKIHQEIEENRCKEEVIRSNAAWNAKTIFGEDSDERQSASEPDNGGRIVSSEAKNKVSVIPFLSFLNLPSENQILQSERQKQADPALQ